MFQNEEMSLARLSRKADGTGVFTLMVCCLFVGGYLSSDANTTHFNATFGTICIGLFIDCVVFFLFHILPVFRAGLSIQSFSSFFLGNMGYFVFGFCSFANQTFRHAKVCSRFHLLAACWISVWSPGRDLWNDFFQPQRAS